MPYYIYRINGPKQLEQLSHHTDYKSARTEVREQRASLQKAEQANPQAQVRIIFAKNPAEAEKLLSIPREERYIDEG